MPETPGPLRIAVVAPPMVAVPPLGYAGTERVVATLVGELHRRGHRVTLYAAGDSDVPCELVPIVDRALWAAGMEGDVGPAMASAAEHVWADHERFDLIHSHLEAFGFLLARHCPTPVVSTLHGRLDVAGMPDLLDEFREIPLVSISDNQRRWWPQNNWMATVHHGLPLDRAPFGASPGEYLALVGRLAREKGVGEAVEVARRTGMRLRIAAKMREPSEQEIYDQVVRPAEQEGIVEFLGELETADRDALYAGAFATLMLGAWPEPFGIVAIESLATGTPVIARKTGALPEIVEHGTDGFVVDDETEAELAVDRIPSIDRSAVRRRALARFSAERMVDHYEAVYRRLARAPGPGGGTGGVAGGSAGGGSGSWPVGARGRALVPGMDPDLFPDVPARDADERARARVTSAAGPPAPQMRGSTARA